MKKILILLSYLYAYLLPGQKAQLPSIMVGQEKYIDLGYPDLAFVESQLSIDPNDPKHMLAGAIMVDPTRTDDYWNVALTTFDGGVTWKFHKFEIPQAADPWGLIMENGEALFSVLGFDSLLVYHSVDGGKTWGKAPINLGVGHDHQVLVEDRSNGPYKNSVYLTSIKGNDIYIARKDSTNKPFQGISQFKANNLNTNTLTPVVLSDGTLIASYINFQRYGTDGAQWLQNELAWIVKSNDGGRTFSPPLFVSEACGKGFDQLGVDASDSKYKDRLYWLCATPKDRAIYFHYSTDSGNKWSQPFPIRTFNQDTTYERPVFNNAPMMAVNKEGIIGIIWQEREQHPPSKCQYLYFTASVDGGQTFLPPVKISQKPSCPLDGKNGWAGIRWKPGGDYQGLATTANGNFLALWSDSRSGIFQLYQAEIKVSARN
ncbi:MAG: sialidase family protein [Saprospiraceae bacterium]